MKTRITSILLLLVLAAPIVGTLTFLHFHKLKIKKEIKHKIISKIDLQDLVLLKFTDEQIENDLEWKHSKEFEFNSSMYDIVESKKVGDTTLFWCWHDDQETKLNKQLNQVLGFAMDTNSSNNEKKNTLITFYKSLYFFNDITRNIYAFSSQELSINYIQLQSDSDIKPPEIPPKYFI